MRTKALCAAALAAGALTSMAQVYSANVVGYVNVTVAGGGNFTMVANPFDATMGGTVANGNNTTNLFANASDSDIIFRWKPSIGDFDPVTPAYSGALHAWDSGFNLVPGEGVLYYNNGATRTVTFVGQVNQGTWSYSGGNGGAAGVIPGQGQFSLIGAPVPLGGSFTNSIIGLAPSDSDIVFTWNSATGDFNTTTPTYSGPLHAWGNTEVQIAPGTGFLYYDNSSSATVPWTVNFTVQ